MKIPLSSGLSWDPAQSLPSCTSSALSLWMHTHTHVPRECVRECVLSLPPFSLGRCAVVFAKGGGRKGGGEEKKIYGMGEIRETAHAEQEEKKKAWTDITMHTLDCSTASYARMRNPPPSHLRYKSLKRERAIALFRPTVKFRSDCEGGKTRL